MASYNGLTKIQMHARLNTAHSGPGSLQTYDLVDSRAVHKIALDTLSPKKLLIKNYADTTLGYVDLPTGASIVPGTWSNKSGNVYTSFDYTGAIVGDIIAIAPGDADTYARLEYNATGRNIGDVIDFGGGYYYNRTEIYDTQRTTYLIKVDANRYLDITDRTKSIFSSISSVSSMDDAIAKVIRFLGTAAYIQANEVTNNVIDLYDSNDTLLTPTNNTIIWGVDGVAYNIQYFSSPVTIAYAKNIAQFSTVIQGICSKWSGLFTQSLSTPVPGIYTSDMKYTPIYTPAASNCVILIYRYSL